MSSPLDELRARIGSSLRTLVAGDRQPRREAPGDGGLFGPDSATWQVHGDASMLVGGIRALVIQTLHPPTMAGVADHSDYRHDPLGRLQRTSGFLGTTTFGTVAQAEQAIAVVNAIHERVEGTTPDGTPYSARDPHLLAWVHATEVDSFLEAKRHFGSSSISQSTADAYVDEMAEIAQRLGVVDPPRTTDQLDIVLRSYEPELAHTNQSREALRFITFAPLPVAMWGPYSVLLGGAVSSLPRWIRRRLWIPRLPLAETIAVRPAAHALVRILDWSLQTPEPA
jgi:uncharacterized protein (DUF2236 family)